MGIRVVTVFTVLVIALAASFVAGLSIGSTGARNPLEVIMEFAGGDPGAITMYRLLRTTAALVLGAGLAASGLTLQYALRNPMADPYLLGVSTGAAFGVVLLFATARSPRPELVYLSGLLWGTIAFLMVIGIGAYMGAGPTSLIVAGVSVSYTFFGLIVILMTRAPETQRINYTWLFGTVAYPTRTTLLATAIIVAVSVAGMALASNRLYTLILGDEVAESTGVRVARLRLLSVALASAAASALVAMAGPVGFIGLAAPWAVRLAIGSKYSTALAGSMMLGAIAAVGSDIAVRLLGGGSEVPLTAVTALFGGPVLFYLSRRTGW